MWYMIALFMAGGNAQGYALDKFTSQAECEEAMPAMKATRPDYLKDTAIALVCAQFTTDVKA